MRMVLDARRIVSRLFLVARNAPRSFIVLHFPILASHTVCTGNDALVRQEVAFTTCFPFIIFLQLFDTLGKYRFRVPNWPNLSWRQDTRMLRLALQPDSRSRSFPSELVQCRPRPVRGQRRLPGDTSVNVTMPRKKTHLWPLAGHAVLHNHFPGAQESTGMMSSIRQKIGP
jgi:hypothetical protein